MTQGLSSKVRLLLTLPPRSVRPPHGYADLCLGLMQDLRCSRPLLQNSSRRAAVQATRPVTCSAQPARDAGKAIAAAALAAAVSLGSVQAAHADIAGLTPCSQSKPFAKRQKGEVKALQKRLSKVSWR